MQRVQLEKSLRVFLVLLITLAWLGALSKDMAYAADKQEEYVWIAALSSFPMFVENDQVGFKRFGEELGVKVTIAGPTEWDLDAFAKSIEEVAARKPAGMLVYGFSPILKNAINKAMEMGVPVVTADADVADSKRLAFVGTNWYEVGRTHAEEMAKLLNKKGKVAAIMVIGIDIYEDCIRGYKEVLAKYPKMELVGVYNSEANAETTARLTTDIVTSTPDLAGISCFDGTTPGVGAALKEMGKQGKILVTGMNVDPPQIKYLKEGVFQVLVGQKRALFGYYGGKLLYDYNHSKVKITPNDKGVNLTILPDRIDTGLFIINLENVAAFEGK